MKQWFKENKVRLVLSSLVTLLPMLFGIVFWNKLPDVFTTHWGADGVADGFGGKAFAVFVPTAIMFALNVLCVVGTAFDQNSRNQNKKALSIIIWIVPIISILINGIMYNVAFNAEVNFEWLFPALFGVLFVVMGNYMPKIAQNRTMGVKISWTLNNEENWNKTHRLTGRLWVAGGVVLIAVSFLPLKWVVSIFIAVLLMMIVVPFAYSYSIYRRHKKQGISYTPTPKTKAEIIAVKVSAIFVPLILVGVCILMFTGSIQYELTEDAIKINATYYDDITVKYDTIESVEYRENFDFGVRSLGYSSAKLSMGVFKNDEFGNYTLYSYTGSHDAVVIKADGKVLVIAEKEIAQTQKLFRFLNERIG